jgi:glycosyltransferase involved in cell wall biosynthesis
MRILLVSNYAPDRQESMLRFATFLHEGLKAKGHDLVTVRPEALLGRFLSRRNPLSKWTAYVDKLVIFPPRLGRVSARFDIAHLCDHSNAIYRPRLRSKAVVATCHDLLAVRGAMGEDTYCPASGLGRRLQASILRNLAATPYVACDSEATRGDFTRLTGRQPGTSLRTIRLGFGQSFRRGSDGESAQLLSSLGLSGGEYVLHVGSSQPRKNREGMLKAVAGLGAGWSGKMVFVGESLSPEQLLVASSLGVDHRIVQLGRLDDDSLAAVYAGAHAFIFPSFCEGFGWPILEAQACGCPVITADNTSLKEVAGDGAIITSAEDTAGIGQAILDYCDPFIRQQRVMAGFRNLDRFTMKGMIDAYETLYREALAYAQ